MNNIQRVIEALDKVAEQPSPIGNRAWTKAIKIAVGDIGIENEYEVLANQVKERPDFQSEWLFDLVWYEGADLNETDAKTKRPALKSLPLILESEWSRHFEDLRHDLEKLHIAKSPLKVFIFEANSEEYEGLMTQIRDSIDKFSGYSPDETYLISCLILDQEEYEFKHQVIPDREIAVFN